MSDLFSETTCRVDAHDTSAHIWQMGVPTDHINVSVFHGKKTKKEEEIHLCFKIYVKIALLRSRLHCLGLYGN